jgi:hypothetical protein
MTVTEEPLCRWDIPGPGGVDPYQLEARAGGATVVVGRNGAGKSALGYWMQVNAHGDPNVQVQRVIAHRRNWFDAAGPGITAGGLVVGPAARTHLHKRTARPPSRSKRKSAEPVADIRHALLVDARSLSGRTWASCGARTAGSGRTLCHRQDRSPAEHPREGKDVLCEAGAGIAAGGLL